MVSMAEYAIENECYGPATKENFGTVGNNPGLLSTLWWAFLVWNILINWPM